MDMRFNNITLASVLVAAFVFAGCGNMQPIVNIDSAPVTTYSDKATMKKVEKAITQALTDRQFKPKIIKPGLIEGRYLNSKFDVIVEIKYDTKSYSITHKSSTPNLGYDGTNIHRRYNSWILRIDKSIRAHLSQI
jgi:hypothetical protein